jgi:flagellar assembly factor FliW
MLTLQENKAQNRIECEEVSFPLNLAFPSGILGFEEVKDYVLQPLPDLNPFFWMEGVTGKQMPSSWCRPPMFSNRIQLS